ncbi:hypothetical protein PFLUV_G00211980 [Scomber scombrus]|uniref:Triadin n=1 Tax=Scomber scombrus TaxID=13677 RepID=A0AAV1NSJ0_SCOSC
MGTEMDRRTERDSREERLTPAICQVKHRETPRLFRVTDQANRVRAQGPLTTGTLASVHLKTLCPHYPLLVKGRQQSAVQNSSRTFEGLKVISRHPANSKSKQLFSPMSSQTSDGGAAPPSRPNQKTFLDDVILTFTSPMAWLLVVALIITWSAVAIVLFDLLDYKTLAEYTSYCDDPMCLSAGLPPPSAIAKRGLRSRGVVRSIKSSHAGVPGEAAAQGGTDWLELLWNFAASLVAPDDEEEEGIHQLTETFTSFHSEEL